MKEMMKKLIREEKGAALIGALILLLVGGLTSAALLNHMGSGILAGEVHERRTAEFYAADAGVEDAIWKLQNGEIPVCPANPEEWSYNVLDINGKSLQVSIEYLLDESSFKITSTAATDDGSGTAAIESNTAVEAYIEAMTFDLLSGALVSSGDITFHKDCTVTGDVYYVGEIIGKDYTHTEGDEIQIPLSVFPSQEQNDAFVQEFENEALAGGIYGENGGNMDISESQNLGPIYVPGNLDISKEVTINLEGVVYVEGYIKCEKTLSITGEGSLIAESDIYLSKLADYTVTGDSAIMSVNGDITLKKSDAADELSIQAFVYAPNGTVFLDKDMTVTGSVMGAGIQIDKDGSFTYISKTSGFEFPPVVVYGGQIKSYSINQG
jgi:hypothetical protein